MQVSVYRYNPDLDEVPVMRDVEVELPEGRDLMVLDVLHLMKDADPTELSPKLPRRRVRFRWCQYEWQERSCVHHAGIGSRETQQTGFASTCQDFL